MPTYVLKNHEQLGPFDDAMIFSCLADGRFLYEDLAWREGWANWRQLREVYPAPSREARQKASASQNPDAPETKLWSARPSLWGYLPSWVVGLPAMGVGIAVLYSGNKNWFAAYLPWDDAQPWLSFIIAAIVCIGAAVILSPFYSRLGKRYTVTDKRLITTWGIFVISTTEIRIEDIRSINVRKRGLSGLLFDVGTVEFSSAATDMADVIFWRIDNPHQVRDLVRKQQS